MTTWHVFGRSLKFTLILSLLDVAITQQPFRRFKAVWLLQVSALGSLIMRDFLSLPFNLLVLTKKELSTFVESRKKF